MDTLDLKLTKQDVLTLEEHATRCPRCRKRIKQFLAEHNPAAKESALSARS